MMPCAKKKSKSTTFAKKVALLSKKCAAAGPKTKFNPLVVILLFIDTAAVELRPLWMKSFIRVEKNENKTP